jgi:hypothetical protein
MQLPPEELQAPTVALNIPQISLIEEGMIYYI